ncbi:MAG: hypothetical protein KGH98_01875 [Candidatus Micrarchaeota archaeon]|nr:hypothetical protein [Candidatus Micrarchaeota archaeon]
MAERTNDAKLQSALEYLVTYGWALVIIAVAAVLLYAYINSPGQVTSSSCNFVQGAYCNDMVLGTNITTHQTVVAFYLTNIQQYPIESPTIYANVNGTNSTGNACKPNFVLAGGSIICILNLPVTTTLGALVSGNVYLKAKYCGLVNIPNSAASCAAAPYQTFLGSFVGHAQPVVNPNVTLSITANTLRPPANNQKDALFVHVKLLGYPLNAATVNLTTNNSGYTVSPNPVRSNTTGIALSYINSTIVGNVIVTANYSGTLANITLDFLPVSYIGFGLPSYSSSVCGTSPIITIDGTNYDYAQLTSQLSFATGSSHNYCIISPACSNGNTQYIFNSIVIGGVTYTNQCGIINVNGNTTIVILPTVQYHLSESANPNFGGTVSPGSGWFDSGSPVTINEITNPGWFFNGWTGSPYSGASTSDTFTITAPATETAGFYSTTTTTTTSTSTSTSTTTSTSTSTSTSTTTSTSTSTTTTSTIAQTYNPPGGNFNGDIIYSSSTQLTSSAIASNMILVETGVTVNENGNYLEGNVSFYNYGTVTDDYDGGAGGAGGYVNAGSVCYEGTGYVSSDYSPNGVGGTAGRSRTSRYLSTTLTGGTGGTGGQTGQWSCWAIQNGGPGGLGGGIVEIYTYNLVNSGSISASGFNGGAGGNGFYIQRNSFALSPNGGAGGGTGGSGGTVFIGNTIPISNTGTIQANGGVGGKGGEGGYDTGSGCITYGGAGGTNAGGGGSAIASCGAGNCLTQNTNDCSGGAGGGGAAGGVGSGNGANGSGTGSSGQVIEKYWVS